MGCSSDARGDVSGDVSGDAGSVAAHSAQDNAESISGPISFPPLPRISVWNKARYRVAQFWTGFTATVTEQELAEVAAQLPSAALALFLRMPVDARRHSINVMQSVLAAGYAQRELLQAALLHDVGKTVADAAGARIGLWQRGPLVLAETFTPGLLARSACDAHDSGWRYAVYVQLNHPRLGADLAAAAGCDSLVCWLIAHHQTQAPPGTNPTAQQLLAALQWADAQH
ncbi:MAG: HD domain-containing protein [Caldilineaceae bacterium]|nr:HD domain-containing protein [Caldilineaceae bacterium]